MLWHVWTKCCAEMALCTGVSYQRLLKAQGGVPIYSLGRLNVEDGTGCAAVQCMCGGSISSADGLQRTSR